MTKRQRTDTAKGAINSMKGATTSIDPPDWIWLPEEAMPFWKSITNARAADRWNNSDLEMAAELARTKAKIDRINKELYEESDIIRNDKGTQIVNPKHSLLETLTRRMIALSKSLQVHAEATQGKSREQVKANKAQQAAQTAINDVDEDDLIPRATH